MLESIRDRPNDTFHSTIDIVQNISSEATFFRVKTWLDDCLTNYIKYCFSDKSFFPRRFVNVGSWNGDTEPFLTELKELCLYLTLSYCWGVDINKVPTITTIRLKAYIFAKNNTRHYYFLLGNKNLIFMGRYVIYCLV